MTTLSIERSGFGRDRSADPLATRDGPIYDEYAEEVRIAIEPYTWYPQRAGRPICCSIGRAKRARSRTRRAPGDRQARSSWPRARRLRIRPRRPSDGAGSNEVVPAGSIGKLAASTIARQCSVAHTLIQGDAALLAGRRRRRGRHRFGSIALGPCNLHRGRHRRDSAQHRQRARPRHAQGAALRYRPLPRHSEERPKDS